MDRTEPFDRALIVEITQLAQETRWRGIVSVRRVARERTNETLWRLLKELRARAAQQRLLDPALPSDTD